MTDLDSNKAQFSQTIKPHLRNWNLLKEMQVVKMKN